MRILLFLFFALSLSTGWCQLNNHVFEDRMAVDPADSGKLFLGVNTLGFFRNNEYMHTLIKGYTLFGYQFQPFFSYHLTPNVRIDAGGYFQKDFGNSDISTAAPIFSVKWKSRDFSVIFGTLEGSLNHRLIEPLFDFERVLINRLETGVQFLWIRDGLFADAWFDWQYMQYWRDTRQEQFVGGLSIEKRVVRLGSGALYLPLQVVARHTGGQLDVAGQPIQSVVNTAVGLNWIQPLTGWASKIAANGYYVYDKDITETRQPYLDGDGVYVNASVTTHFGLEVMATYWQAREFMSIQGGQIFTSISPQDGLTLQPSPHLMMLRFLYDYKVADDLFVSLRYEPYYDLAFKSFQYSYGFYINYRARYFLAKPAR